MATYVVILFVHKIHWALLECYIMMLCKNKKTRGWGSLHLFLKSGIKHHEHKALKGQQQFSLRFWFLLLFTIWSVNLMTPNLIRRSISLCNAAESEMPGWTRGGRSLWLRRRWWSTFWSLHNKMAVAVFHLRCDLLLEAALIKGWCGRGGNDITCCDYMTNCQLVGWLYNIISLNMPPEKLSWS